jgi:hypothetical protein
MKRLATGLSPTRLLLGLGALACVASCQITHQKMSPADLPSTLFEATVYRGGTGAPAVILDDPNDDVLLSPGRDAFQFKKQGLQMPEKYLKELAWRPPVYRLQHIESGEVLGYLLLSPELEWLVSYDKDKKGVNVWIEDPDALGGP